MFIKQQKKCKNKEGKLAKTTVVHKKWQVIKQGEEAEDQVTFKHKDEHHFQTLNWNIFHRTIRLFWLLFWTR